MPAHAISKSVPRYITVAQTLMQEIEQGKFPVGGMLPTEIEICERFAISRYTAREAVRQLTDLGLVTRRAGVGTTIQAKSVNARYTASISDPSDLFAFTKQTRVQLLGEDQVEIKGEWLKVLPDAAGQSWPRFTSLRYPAGPGGKEPIAYTETLVQPSYAAIRDRIHRPGQTVYQLIEELRGEKVHALQQEITCVSLPKKIAELLHAKPGAPALRVLRYYLGADESLLSVAINTHPQDRFKLTTRWQLNWNAE
ncbi:GntR family transcriptional regulator [Ramlibacter sp. G-1-2-2]|uniref:GntR family transcriptional regulator n=1 Tax=Ramlibacter agri TaxID=2728837 RepID=A0A848H1G1_9BURK|nr:GntR family transcriptional regulator [Ramlibacter agri]NML44826.1 GntR family transcriptional regulator [Ramlibacter agri]